jgi:5-formyltetrahydrofolate cyclo-ligase
MARGIGRRTEEKQKMTTALNEQKAALRKQIRTAIQMIPPTARAAASGQTRTQLKEQTLWKNAESVLFFAPMPDEVDVWPLLAEVLASGKIAALPRYDFANNDYVACRLHNLQSEIVPGQFGIREPRAGCPEIPLERLGLILVPGVAFDLCGGRLGRGRGFYDRLLPEIHGIKCGVAFDEQIVNEVPAGTLDVRMDFILTPTRLVKIAD